MERTAALALTSRIEATWSNGRPWPGSRCDAWVDALADLDEGAAGTAFVRLRNGNPEPPSIAQFLATTRSLRTTDASAEKIECGECDSTGWVAGPDLICNAGTDREYRNSQVKPCPRCVYGQQATRSTAWTERTSA